VTAQLNGYGMIECRIILEDKVIQELMFQREDTYPTVSCSG